jgi:glutamine---fructose-6-phosphate transaminase (isomerizing)
MLKSKPLRGNLGIGHTRWATHGRPSDFNAHPHSDCKHSIAVVHNGIIENYLTLKEKLQSQGHKFISETDTEIIAHLIEHYYQDNLEEAVRRALLEIKGSYAIGVLCKFEPDKIVLARKDNPLIIGLGKGENFAASDIPAFLPYTRQALLLHDQEIAILTKDKVTLRNLEGDEVKRSSFEVMWDAKMAEKGGYKHFMLKEIFEQPRVVFETLLERLDINGNLNLKELNLTSAYMQKIKKIFIIACGTAYHAGMVGKYLIEELARIPVEVDLASEFRYRNPIIEKDTLVLAISQSGETADTLAAAKEAKAKGAKLISICNVVGSSLTRESEGTLYTRAGIEIGVAATKTFVAQLVALYLLAYYLAANRNLVKPEQLQEFATEIYQVPQYIEMILNSHSEIVNIARRYYKCSNFLFLGRNLHYPIALEGALKLKEISYIHAEGYAAGEMKHGPISLIEENVPVVAVAMQGWVYDKILSNIREVKARDAITIGIVSSGDEEVHKYFDHLYYAPATSYLLSPLIAAIPMQLLAYYISDKKGCDVDQPRNLAKSVTVE